MDMPAAGFSSNLIVVVFYFAIKAQSSDKGKISFGKMDMAPLRLNSITLLSLEFSILVPKWRITLPKILGSSNIKCYSMHLG